MSNKMLQQTFFIKYKKLQRLLFYQNSMSALILWHGLCLKPLDVYMVQLVAYDWLV